MSTATPRIGPFPRGRPRPDTRPRSNPWPAGGESSRSDCSSGRPTGRSIGSPHTRALKRREHLERRRHNHHRMQRKPAAARVAERAHRGSSPGSSALEAPKPPTSVPRHPAGCACPAARCVSRLPTSSSSEKRNAVVPSEYGLRSVRTHSPSGRRDIRVLASGGRSTYRHKRSRPSRSRAAMTTPACRL